MFQSTKSFILLNPQHRIQWANFNRAQPTANASSDNVTVIAFTGSSSCLQLRVQNPLKRYILNTFNASQFRRQFHLCSAHLTQFTSADTFHRYQKVENVPEGVFRGLLDRFKGITVESHDEYDKNIDFSKKLKKSLDFWIANEYRAIWFYILTEHVDWIPHLIQEKFEFHHAKKGIVVMCRWLPNNEKSHIPFYAHTLIGVGGLVFNNKKEMLVVTDKYALVPNGWKLPGGYVDPGENLVDAAIREVWEETSIRCNFQTLVAVRHSHNGEFGCGDIYVVVALIPHTLKFKCCEDEIVKIEWMPIDEYLKHPNVHGANRHFAKILQNYYERGVDLSFEAGRHVLLNKDYQVFYVKDNKLQRTELKAESTEPKDKSG